MTLRVLGIYLLIFIVLIVLFRFVSPIDTEPLPVRQTSVEVPTPTYYPEPAEGVEAPVADFKSRITKKFFGTFVTPQNSPVSPEKFRGFHTGVDVEYGDITAKDSVKAVASGQIIYSGFVSGYGGFIAQQISLNNEPYIAIYGHLRPSSLVKKGTTPSAGDPIGVLGTAYSAETNGERRHLHFALLKGTKLDFRGYVQSQSDLSLWSDPLLFYK